MSNQIQVQKKDKKGSLFIPGLEDYINDNLVYRPHRIFHELEEYAKKENVPIISPMVGAILASWIRLHMPKTILELGTGAGYSLHWMLAYVDWSIKIHTYERRESLFCDVKKYWETSPFKNYVDLEFRNASILTDWEEGKIDIELYDMVFADADKVTYPIVFDYWMDSIKKHRIPSIQTNPKIRNKNYHNRPNNEDHTNNVNLSDAYLPNDLGGQRAILFDNALWHGRLLSPEPQKKSDQAMLELWDKVKSSGLYYELYPAGDGLLIVYNRTFT